MDSCESVARHHSALIDSHALWQASRSKICCVIMSFTWQMVIVFRQGPYKSVCLASGHASWALLASCTTISLDTE
jgi:hypothetical protein